MATTLIHAFRRAVAADESDGPRLEVPSRALASDTHITIVLEKVAVSADWRVLSSWRILAHPAPVRLTAPATLSLAVPRGVAPRDLCVLVGEEAFPVPGEAWRLLPITHRDDGRVDARLWYLPPSVGVPPLSSSLVCLATRVR